jgi:hypothetical protein
LSHLVTDTEDLSDTAREHGRDLLSRGFRIDQVVRGCGAVVRRSLADVRAYVDREEVKISRKAGKDAAAVAAAAPSGTPKEPPNSSSR